MGIHMYVLGSIENHGDVSKWKKKPVGELDWSIKEERQCKMPVW